MAQALTGAIRLTVALSRPRIIPNPACKVFNLTMVRLWQKGAGRCQNVGRGSNSEWNIVVAPLGATRIEFVEKNHVSGLAGRGSDVSV